MRYSNLFILLLAGCLASATAQAQSSSDMPRLEHELQQLRLNAEGLTGGSHLGLRLADIDTDRAQALKLPEERGVEITEVEEGSPAEAAGIRKGDVLLNYNGENILGAQQFIRLVQETPVGRKVKIQLWRDGKTQTVTVTTAEAKPLFNVPPNFIHLQFPRGMDLPDIPSPIVVWKNSIFGMECESVDSQLAQYFGVKRGVLVRSVEKGSTADKAGMKAGDVLIAMGDRPLASAHDITSYMRSEHPTGKSIAFSVVRDHKPLTINVVSPENQQ